MAVKPCPTDVVKTVHISDKGRRKMIINKISSAQRFNHQASLQERVCYNCAISNDSHEA